MDLKELDLKDIEIYQGPQNRSRIIWTSGIHGPAKQTLKLKNGITRSSSCSIGPNDFWDNVEHQGLHEFRNGSQVQLNQGNHWHIGKY